MKKIAFILPNGSAFDTTYPNSVDQIARRNFEISKSRVEALILFPMVENRSRCESGCLAYLPSDAEESIFQLLSDFQPDLIEVHRDHGLAVALSERLACEVIYYCHDFIPPPEGQKSSNQLSVVSVSHAHSIFVRQQLALKHTPSVIYNSVASDVFYPDEKENVVLIAGRLIQEKGVFEAIAAFRQVSSEFEDWRFKVFVDTRHTSAASLGAFKSQCADVPRLELYLNESVKQLAPHLNSAEIALTPSYREPFGLTALEAHQAGVCLVSSMRDGLAEVSRDAALAVNTIEPDDLADALRLLMSSPSDRERLRIAGSERARHFSVERLSPALWSLWGV